MGFLVLDWIAGSFQWLCFLFLAGSMLTVLVIFFSFLYLGSMLVFQIFLIVLIFNDVELWSFHWYSSFFLISTMYQNMIFNRNDLVNWICGTSDVNVLLYQCIFSSLFFLHWFLFFFIFLLLDVFALGLTDLCPLQLWTTNWTTDCMLINKLPSSVSIILWTSFEFYFFE